MKAGSARVDGAVDANELAKLSAVELLEGYRARVPPLVLVQVALIVLLRTGIDNGNFIPGVNIASSLIVDLFRGHKWAARLLTKAIDETLYLEGPWNPTSPAYLDALARVRRGVEKRVRRPRLERRCRLEYPSGGTYGQHPKHTVRG